MAHVYKVKRSALAPMVAHYERTPELERGYERDNIDSSRTHLNYNLAPHDVLAAVDEAVAMHERNSGRKIRSDANLVYDWVVTQPKDVREGDSRRFFEAVRDFAMDTYGSRVLGVYVHMDETTPHAHIPVLPVKDGKLNGKEVINRSHMRQFHPRLSKAVEEKLGYPVSIELDESARGEKELSRLDQKDYRAAKKRLAELADEVSREEGRLESAKQETVRAKSDLETVQEAVRDSVSRKDAIDEEIRQCIAASRQRAAEAAGAAEKAAEEQQRLADLRAEIEAEQRRKECLQREAAEIEEETARADRQSERLEGTIPVLEIESNAAREVFEVYEAGSFGWLRLARATAEARGSRERAGAVEGDIEQVRSRIAEVRRRTRENRAAIARIAPGIERLESELAELRTRLAAALERVREVIADLVKMNLRGRGHRYVYGSRYRSDAIEMWNAEYKREQAKLQRQVLSSLPRDRGLSRGCDSPSQGMQR